MKSYESKEMLIMEIDKALEKYLLEFKKIPEELGDIRINEVDKTQRENLSYQLGWINLLLSWDQDELLGKEVHTPAKGYKWNNLGGLYQSFCEKYHQNSLKELQNELRKKVVELEIWLNTLTDEELFEPCQRKWATTSAKWPIWKWVHINSVAPFTNFRTKIRKWKKIVL